jgi:hypothetical protein
MDTLILALMTVLALLGATLAKLLADEFKAWSAPLVSIFLNVAVGLTPLRLRERCAEEWSSHVDEVPGDLSKVIFAIGCVYAGWKISQGPTGAGKRLVDIGISLAMLVTLLPSLTLTALTIKIISPNAPILARRRTIGQYGRQITLLKFRTSGAPHEARALSFLRRSGLNELPILLNVLKGDMSLVGPRLGEVETFLDEELSEYRPGLCGIHPLHCKRYYSDWSIRKDFALMWKFLQRPLS